MIALFGYGSLLDPQEVKWHTGTAEPVIEAVLPDYKRSWNAADSSGRYLGITPNQGSSVNGVVFHLPESNLARFKRVENIPRLYSLERVGWIVDGHIFPFKVHGGEPVFACQTRRPTREGEILPQYLKEVRRALATRSPEFQLGFWMSTPKAV